jgi:hypothetical protein
MFTMVASRMIMSWQAAMTVRARVGCPRYRAATDVGGVLRREVAMMVPWEEVEITFSGLTGCVGEYMDCSRILVALSSIHRIPPVGVARRAAEGGEGGVSGGGSRS